MSRVDDLLAAYKEAFRSGGDPDPGTYLDRLSGRERDELAALIDGFLATMPPRPYDAFDTHVSALVGRVLDSVREHQPAETWVTLLPRARTEAQLLRADLVRQLAQDLDAADQVDTVATYYHQMEQGLLPARGVSDRVLDALSRLVRVPVARLRAAGERMVPPASPGGTVFARSSGTASEPPADAMAAEAPADEWDHVDELFRGQA